MKRRSLALLTHFLALILIVSAAAAGDGGLFREDFDTTEKWEPLTFPKIKKHSRYSIETTADGSVLRAESNGSASGISYKDTYDVYEYPRLRWRWKAEGTYLQGDASRKSGDDYPIRIYIVFPYDAKHIGFGEKVKYKAARLVYGKYPPLAALNYIWANRPGLAETIPNAYTAKAIMIPLRGPGDTGRWHVEEANVLEDFRRAFGKDPPPRAGLAIMNDSDDTGESSVSYIDYIEVFR